MRFVVILFAHNYISCHIFLSSQIITKQQSILEPNAMVFCCSTVSPVESCVTVSCRNFMDFMVYGMHCVVGSAVSLNFC